MKLARGQVAVVTGAASGLGRALSVALSRRGLRLALVDRDAPGLDALRAELGEGASAHALDVADRAAMEALPALVVAAHGGVDLLINNAGVSVGGALEHTPVEDYAWIFGVNVFGVLYGCKFFLPHLRQRPQAHILNISSTFGLMGFPNKSAYAATKFAVRGLSESLRAELHGGTVGVSCGFLGAVRTGIVRASRVSSERSRALEDAYLQQTGITPERAALALLAGVERDRSRILVGADVRAIDLAARALGGALPSLIGKNRKKVPFLES